MLEIYNEDCIETMKRMKEEYVDLTVTSPPYDNLRNYNNSLEWNFDKFKQVADLLYKITKKGGVVVWIVGDATVDGSESLSSFKQAIYFNEIGFNIHDTMIYQKSAMPKNHNRYEQDFEYMFVLSKGKPNTFNPIKIPCKYPEKEGARKGKFYGEHEESLKATRSGKERKPVGEEKIKGNIWYYAVGKNHSTHDEIAFKHPAIFPEKLAEDHILSWSNEGDIVYDPFLGSGTTGKMAIHHNRKFIGSEKVESYYEISKERLGLKKSKLESLFD